MAGRDITESTGYYDLSVDIGIVSSNALWSNTDVSYDTAVGGLPFIYAINDTRPYLRQTAPFKKDQFDNGAEPGEQSLSGWWLRSQSSFHGGAGVNFFDPLSNDENGHYRFNDSKGVNVWTKGQATLLKSCSTTHHTTGPIASNGTVQQHVRSIKWNSTSGVLLHDEYDVDKIAVDGTLTHFIDYISGTDSPVYAICDDGTFAYWITNTATKKTVYKKPLTGAAPSSGGTTADIVKMFDEVGTISNATMEYVKDRIIMCADNKVYEFPTSAVAMPTTIYPHPTTTHVYTSVAASGPAVYVSGYNGIQSTIQKFNLVTSGATAGNLLTMSSAAVAAEMPVGEVIHKIYYYLGKMAIGTSKGIRVATVSDSDGSITYGPLIVQTSQPVYDFAARDKYIWCATGVGGEPGTIRIDLGTEIEPLRYAYANDVYSPGVSGHVTTGCAFADGTDRLIFTTAYASSENGGIYIEDASTLLTTGYVTTGKVRYSTLEPKNFKRLLVRGNFNKGSLTLQSVTKDGTIYDHITYESGVSPVEVATTQPETPQEYVSFKFIFNRDSTTTSTGPTFEGWQAKATIATPRQRVMQFPVYCFDVETDRYNTVVGYEGRADDRLRALEAIEENGDVVIWQDLTTGESRQCVIEQVTFSRMTPPDKRFDGQGGVLEIRIRTV